MKRIVCSLLILAFIVFSLQAEENELAEVKRSNAILFQPVALALSLLIGLEATVEYQHAFGKYFVLSVMPDIIVVNGTMGMGLFMGALVHPMGTGLKGFYLGAYPGILFVSSYALPIVMLDIGYQWILKNSGIVLGVGGGAKWSAITGVGANFTFNLGFAF